MTAVIAFLGTILSLQYIGKKREKMTRGRKIEKVWKNSKERTCSLKMEKLWMKREVTEDLNENQNKKR